MSQRTDTALEASQNGTSDEISLRELFLLLKRNALIILAAPMLVAMVVYAVLNVRPATYVSESVVVVTPPAIAIEGARGLTFQPSAVRFETYEALALSSPVLLAVGQHPDVIAATGAPLALRSLRGATSLSALTPASGSTVSASHRASWSDPDVATAIANAWAAETLQAVRFTLLDSLGPVDEATRNEIIELGRSLQAAEAEVEAFDSENLLELARGQLEILAQRVTRDDFAIADLVLQIAVTEGRIEALAAQLHDEMRQVASWDPSSDVFLAGLSLDQAVDILEVQRDAAAVAWHQARATLDAFDAEHDLGRLDLRIEDVTSAIVQRQSVLDALPGQLRIVQDRIAALERQLAMQPDQLRLQESLIGNALLLEAVRGADDALISLGTERSVLNPTAVSLTTQAAEASIEQSTLMARQEAVARELRDLDDALAGLRSERIAIASQRSLLAIEASLTDERYRAATSRLHEAQSASLDGRGERTLRHTTPEILQLQGQLRDERLTLESARAELTARTELLARERGQLANARQTVARLETQRAQLARTVSNARSAYEDVAPLGPIIAYMTQLAPTTARILAGATPPTDAEPRRSALVAALAYVVVAFALVVLVLLREAVRDPNAPVPTRARQPSSTPSTSPG